MLRVAVVLFLLTLTANTASAIPENVALFGTATQSSTFVGADAGRAIDGNTNGNFSAGSVTHTDAAGLEFWQVDLANAGTTEWLIDRIVIWNRTDCCADRLANFTVTILDDAAAVVISQDFHTIPSPRLTWDVNNVERYVKIQLLDVDYLSLR